MNVLLAVIFDNYKRRIGWTSETRSRERMKYITQFFDEFDESDKGWLTVYEAKDFFAHVLDLNFRDKEDRTKFITILRLADPEGAKKLLKHRVLEFFRMSGFLHLDILGDE